MFHNDACDFRPIAEHEIEKWQYVASGLYVSNVSPRKRGSKGQGMDALDAIFTVRISNDKKWLRRQDSNLQPAA